MEGIEIIFGYGSIMSLHGLFQILRPKIRRNKKKIRIQDIKIIHMLEGERGFGKPTTSGDLAMDLDYFKLEGEYVPPRYKPERGFVGIGIVVPRHDFRKICEREGYREHSKLIEKAEANHISVGEYLHKLARRVSPDGVLNINNVRKYRKILSCEIGGSNTGYIPHPLVLNNDIAIVFIAAGKYGTGTGRKSRKEEENIEGIMSVYDYYYRFLKSKYYDYTHFKRYLVECLLGGLYGINLEDLTESLRRLSKENPLLVSAIREEVEKHIHQEIRLAIEHVLNGDPEKFLSIFGDPEENIRHTGLASIGIKMPKCNL